MIKLLPCPFCGSDAEFKNATSMEWYVGCSKKGVCYGNHNTSGCGFSFKSDAVALWNTRTSSQQKIEQDEMLERVTEIIAQASRQHGRFGFTNAARAAIAATYHWNFDMNSMPDSGSFWVLLEEPHDIMGTDVALMTKHPNVSYINGMSARDTPKPIAWMHIPQTLQQIGDK